MRKILTAVHNIHNLAYTTTHATMSLDKHHNPSLHSEPGQTPQPVNPLWAWTNTTTRQSTLSHKISPIWTCYYGHSPVSIWLKACTKSQWTAFSSVFNISFSCLGWKHHFWKVKSVKLRQHHEYTTQLIHDTTNKIHFCETVKYRNIEHNI